MLKRENSILKQENKLLRGEIIKRTDKMEQTELLQLLEFQRMRIDNLEREYDNLMRQFSEKSGNDSQNTNSNYGQNIQSVFTGSKDLIELQQRLEQSDRRCKILEEQIDNVTQTYARQLAQLKSKMTEQGAQLLITAESNIPLMVKIIHITYQTTPGIHKSGVLKKKATTSGQGARLDPIESSATLRQSLQSASKETFPGYSSMNNSIQSNPYQNYPGTSQQQSVNYNNQAFRQGQDSMQPQQKPNQQIQNSFLNQFRMQ
ncbi:UNKNOWN [Stylonychia lemnae]|uniref:Uncharacterized protein n=1 Tax=Stylonychia lemnae TaxID=5949 RepID=A0A078A455_STYLE|nr:UNKNOWN [Stylonychia lemnae]|eukprot:CDW77043.1 UNKNOWN [Stylonychia lemnae]